MRFSTPIFLLLPVLALSNPLAIISNDKGKSVQESIVNIHNKVLELKEAVNNFNVKDGRLQTILVEGIPVLAGVAAVHDVNREGFRRALESAPFSEEITLGIIETAKQTVNVSIIDTAYLLRSKEHVFRTNGLTALVLASLLLLEYDHDTFSFAMALKFNLGVGPERIGEGTSVAANIHLVVQETILYFPVAPLIGGDH